MVEQQCINGALDTAGYSSPVPVIGLYTAAASLLCMLLISCDIAAGFRARKRWLPCKFFTLNSITLILLYIAAKIQFDLTTPMPDPKGQLSKLSGTAFICISMSFFMPSLGINPESESSTNLVAFTIFVITVVVYICMQLSTGVIALFFAEHIIILCSMLILLATMWKFHWDIGHGKKIHSEENREIFRKGDGSVLQRLKTSYLFGYRTNSQVTACLEGMGIGSSTIICHLCFAILIQAAIRALIQLSLCSGISDYDWSISFILLTQILTVFVGTFAVTFRWLYMAKHMSLHQNSNLEDEEANAVIMANPVLLLPKTEAILRIFRLSGRFIFVFLPALALRVFSCSMEEYGEWMRRKSKKEMEILMANSRSESSSSSNHLSQVLISTGYPYIQFNSTEVDDQSLPAQKGVAVSSLSIVLLVRIAQVSLPDNHSRMLIQTFDETKQVFHYIDKIMNPKRGNKLLFAKAVWDGKDFNLLIPRIFSNTTKPPQPQSDLERGVFIIKNLKTVLPCDPVWDELGVIVDFITRKTYSTIEEFVTSVELLFADMVYRMLAQLPDAIFKSLSDCIDEKYEEKVQAALWMVCKVESVAQQVEWSFPAGCNFTSLATTETGPQLDQIKEADVSLADHSDVIIAVK